jgi:hypothetical protein
MLVNHVYRIRPNAAGTFSHDSSWWECLVNQAQREGFMIMMPLSPCNIPNRSRMGRSVSVLRKKIHHSSSLSIFSSHYFGGWPRRNPVIQDDWLQLGSHSHQTATVERMEGCPN